MEKISRLKEAIVNLQWICLLALAASLPTPWDQFNAICTLVLCGLSIIEFIIDRERFHELIVMLRSKAFYALVALYLFYVASLAYSMNLRGGLSNLETRFTLLAIPFVLVRFRWDTKRFNLLLITFVLSTLAVSLVCLINTLYVNYVNGRSYVSYYSWYYSSDSLVTPYGFHPSYFSTYCSVAIFILIDFFKKGKARLILVTFALVYFIIFQMLLASRVGIISFAVVAVLSILYESYLRNRIWLGLAIVMFFFLLMSFSIYNFTILREKFYALADHNIDQYNENFRITKRFESWEAALKVFKQHPVGGVGIGAEKQELKKAYLGNNFEEGARLSYDSHNLFLETLVSCGIIGLVALLSIFGIAFKAAVVERNILYFQFLVLFLMLSCSEASFSVQKGVVFFSFINALFISKGTLYSAITADSKFKKQPNF